jgi:hypothetical protein
VPSKSLNNVPKQGLDSTGLALIYYLHNRIKYDRHNTLDSLEIKTQGQVNLLSLVNFPTTNGILWTNKKSCLKKTAFRELVKDFYLV